MARIVRNTKLETREGRGRLSQSTTPYWQTLHKCGHIGYYKGKNTRAWYARYRNEGVNSGYQKKKIAMTDDFRDSDGKIVLNYREAQMAAQEWFSIIERQRAGHLPVGKYTIANAINDYGQWYKSHRKSWDRMMAQAKAHILPTLGDIEASSLTTQTIQQWHQKLSQTPPRRRTSKFASKQNIGALDSDDAKRRRKSTANRILTILKAALNKAYQNGKIASDDPWRRVKPFKGADSAKIRYLSTDEIKRIVNACEADFRPIVMASLYTGCRYGELIAMLVSDYNQDSGTLLIPESKSGKPRHVVLTDEGQEFFDRAVAGRESCDLVLARADGSKWGKSHQTRRLKDASNNARISPAISFHILRHTHASQLAMSGVPMAVIAHQLGHSDTRIVEKHYAHLAPSYIADTIRSHFPSLKINKEENINYL